MRRALRGQKFDLLIDFSLASATMAQNLYASRICRKSCMIMWDLFPHHHKSIGLISGPVVFKVAYWLESWLIRRFDVVGDAGALAVTATHVVGDKALTATIRDKSRKCLEDVFDVRLAVERIISSAAGGRGGAA